MLSTEDRAQLTEALGDGARTVAELQQGGSPADASWRMALQQKVALGTFAKRRLTGDAHASLTGGKAFGLLESEQPSLTDLVSLLLSKDGKYHWRPLQRPPELPSKATRRGIGALVRWRRDGPAAQASRVADAMTRAAHMPDLSWRGSLGKRTREAAELPWLAECERGAELSKWQHERREARRRELEEAHTEGGEAAEAEGAGDGGTCWLCQGSIEGVVGALGCAGTTGCAGRFCAACLPEIQAGIAAGKLRSCPTCRRPEQPTGPGGAGASLRLCRDFDASRAENKFESIALPLLSPPRDEGAGGDDATMAARLQGEEQAAWLQQRREARRSDARDAHEAAQLQEQLRAQRSSAAAQRDARGAEGGSSTAAARLQRGVESARTGGAAGGGASSSLPSLDAASAAQQSAVAPPPVTAAPDGAAGLATCPCCREDMPKLQMVQLACNHAVCGECLLGMRSAYTEQPPRIDLTHDSGTTSDGTLAPPNCPLCRARISETEFAEAEAIVTAPPAASATPGSAAIGGDDMGGDALDSHALPGAGNLNPSPNHAPIP